MTKTKKYSIDILSILTELILWKFFHRDNFPSARFVLMKGVEADGVTFFTNYGSRKAKEIVCKIKLIIFPKKNLATLMCLNNFV